MPNDESTTAKHRRLQKYREQLQREPARAQRSWPALEQALVDLGLPETRAPEVQWRLKAVGKLLGKIFGLMFPPLFGGRTYHELTRVRGWEKNLPSQILAALPKQKWLRQLQHRGHDLLVTLWRQVEGRSPATRSRWQWTWVSDDSVFKKSGQQLGLVGAWSSGQEHRVRLGIDGWLRIVVIGEGKLVIAGGLHRPSSGPDGAWPTLPRQADLAAGHAGSYLDRPAAAGDSCCQPPWASLSGVGLLGGHIVKDS